MIPRIDETRQAKTSTPKKVDIIWNITLVCMWDCAECCVAAVHVARRGDKIVMRSEDLTKVEEIAFDRTKGTSFDQAIAWRQHRHRELTLEQKLGVLNHLEGYLPKIDFSGGDPLSSKETMVVMEAASQRFGKSQITLTATGAGLARSSPGEIIPLIGELNFTYDGEFEYMGDNPSLQDHRNRPEQYAPGNLKKATQFALAGVRTRAECPLTAQNLDDNTLRTIYLKLHDAGIDKLLLMRLFPVGRGTLKASDIPTPGQYRRAIELLRELEAQYGNPQLKLQCALRFFDNQSRAENPCDLVRESFGLMANGTLLSSPWAVNQHGNPLNEAWVLGNLATTPLCDILSTEKAQEYEQRLDENFGHCKIFSFLYSDRERPLDRIFDTTDPLHQEAIKEAAA
jgi:MoaA/NifB/PqqE/SkfB family radical SAM enzyme